MRCPGCSARCVPGASAGWRSASAPGAVGPLPSRPPATRAHARRDRELEAVAAGRDLVVGLAVERRVGVGARAGAAATSAPSLDRARHPVARVAGPSAPARLASTLRPRARRRPGVPVGARSCARAPGAPPAASRSAAPGSPASQRSSTPSACCSQSWSVAERPRALGSSVVGSVAPPRPSRLRRRVLGAGCHQEPIGAVARFLGGDEVHRGDRRQRRAAAAAGAPARARRPGQRAERRDGGGERRAGNDLGHDVLGAPARQRVEVLAHEQREETSARAPVELGERRQAAAQTARSRRCARRASRAAQPACAEPPRAGRTRAQRDSRPPRRARRARRRRRPTRSAASDDDRRPPSAATATPDGCRVLRRGGGCSAVARRGPGAGPLAMGPAARSRLRSNTAGRAASMRLDRSAPRHAGGAVRHRRHEGPSSTPCDVHRPGRLVRPGSHGRTSEPAPARSPASASSTSAIRRRARGAPRSSATWAPTSSRSRSRGAATASATPTAPGGCRPRSAASTSRASIATSAAITIDIGQDAGVALARRLVRGADVLVENFRPGVMDRHGLGWEALHAENPRLVYCSITAFGPRGPLAQKPGMDLIVQATGGIMGHTGEEGGPPIKSAPPVADITTGVYAAYGIASALVARDADRRRAARRDRDARRGRVALRRQRGQRAHRGHPVPEVRQRASRPGAVPGVPGERRLLHRRLPDQRVLQAPVRRARARRPAHRPALRDQPVARRASRGGGARAERDLPHRAPASTGSRSSSSTTSPPAA